MFMDLDTFIDTATNDIKKPRRTSQLILNITWFSNASSQIHRWLRSQCNIRSMPIPVAYEWIRQSGSIVPVIKNLTQSTDRLSSRHFASFTTVRKRSTSPPDATQTRNTLRRIRCQRRMLPLTSGFHYVMNKVP